MESKLAQRPWRPLVMHNLKLFMHMLNSTCPSTASIRHATL